MKRTVVFGVKETLKLTAVCCFETRVIGYQSTRRHVTRFQANFFTVRVAEGTPCTLRGLPSWTAVRHVATVLVLHCVRYLSILVVRIVLIGLPCRNWTAI
jgi:hypothetical protein